MTQSHFSLINGKYLFHDEKLVTTITNLHYGRPLLTKMEDLEVKEGTETALKILFHVAASAEMAQHMRLPSPTDVAAANSNVFGPATKYGKKHTCLRCKQKFFDLNGKVEKCPSCKTTVSRQ